MVVNIITHCDEEIIEWQWAMDSELIPTPFFTSVYIIDGLLIDTGAPASASELLDYLKSLPEENEIEKCLITHIHEDHAGGAYLIQEELNIPIYASEKAVKYLKKGNEYPQYRKMTWGERLRPVDAMPVGNSIKTTSSNYKFEIYQMPGHSPDLIVPIEWNEGWVFATDAVQKKYKRIFGHNSDIQEDISLIYKSMKKLYNDIRPMKDVKIFLAGSQKTYGRDFLKQKMNEIRDLHHKVHLLCAEFKKKGIQEDRISKKILKEIFGRESVVGKLTYGDLSNMNLIKSLLEWNPKN
ncbi:MAG: hypothetical protein BAJALOKI2v1_140052 [Promethearchaeota archaeon]|nr:MAG: hypothetical protein BAJALOKI2v1_140052 [Candidatus Lokiarchaeota archaeon]